VMETVEMHQPGVKLCLDFSNTVDWRNSKDAQDSLGSFQSLVVWSTKKGIIGRQDATELIQSATGRNLESSTLKRAVELRESIYKIFSAVAHGRKPSEQDIRALNDVLASASVSTRVARKGDQFEWEWDVDGSPQSRLLWPIAKSAADLLTSGKLGRVRECANEEDGCGFVFIDTTKSGTRRWCSMDTCGNRTKVRAWYERNSPKSA
jgi:predicted RNA-binding Zn ribbon-like protein